MRSLKGTFKKYRQDAARLVNNMKGIDKRRSEIRADLGQIQAVLVELVTHTQTVTMNQTNILAKASSNLQEAKNVTRIERALRKESEYIVSLTRKVGTLVKLLRREDGAHAEAQRELEESQRAVTTFMNETMKLVSDISREVTVVRPNMRDNLSDTGKKTVHGDPYIVSSFFHLHTRPRDTTAASIFQRRRGASARRTTPQQLLLTGTAAAAPKAIKASSASKPRKPQKK